MDLQLNRLRSADRLIAGGAIALLIVMFFFDWFGASVSGTLPGANLSGAGSSSSGWDTFTASRWIWLTTSIVALASVGAIARGSRLRTTLAPGAIVMLLGSLSSLLILYRIVHHPVAAVSFGGFHASYGIKLGIWLGLVAALAIAAGGYLQVRAESAPATGSGDREEPAFSGLTVAPKPAPPSPASEGEPPPPAQDAR
jgi:hypothetical protein